MRLGNTMREAMMSMMVPSDKELGEERGDERPLQANISTTESYLFRCNGHVGVLNEKSGELQSQRFSVTKPT